MKIAYLNLEKYRDRNIRMQEILTRQGLGNVLERVAGVLATQPLNGMSLSETGCLLAHHSLLMSLDNSESTLILEDDVSLCFDFGKKIKFIVNVLESSGTDILFLGQTVPFQNLTRHKKFLKFIQNYNENGKHLLLDAKTHYSYGSFAYFINRNSVTKIKELFGRLDFYKSAKPMDELLRNWFRQGELKGRIVFPYLVGIESALESTMFDRGSENSHALQAQLVNLYLDGYLPTAMNEWQKIISEKPNLYALEICKSIYLKLIRS